MPGLHPREETLVAGSSPRSPGRCSSSASSLGYVTLPKGLEVLIGFNQGDGHQPVDFSEYFSFFMRTLLVFGIAFEIPVFVVMLNLAGVVSGKAMGALPGLDHPRRVHLRRRGNAVDRPVHHAFLAVPMLSCSSSPRSSRAPTTGAAAGRKPTPASGRDEASPCDRHRAATYRGLDPFDLPDWLGEGAVIWATDQRAQRPPGRRLPHRPADRCCRATCWPSTRPTRRRSSTRRCAPGVHQTWRHGQVLLLTGRPRHPGRARHRLHRRPGARRDHPRGRRSVRSRRVPVRLAGDWSSGWSVLGAPAVGSR